MPCHPVSGAPRCAASWWDCGGQCKEAGRQGPWRGSARRAAAARALPRRPRAQRARLECRLVILLARHRRLARPREPVVHPGAAALAHGVHRPKARILEPLVGGHDEHVDLKGQAGDVVIEGHEPRAQRVALPPRRL
eukprot:3509695-Prymnesium_polylepis.1